MNNPGITGLGLRDLAALESFKFLLNDLHIQGTDEDFFVGNLDVICRRSWEMADQFTSFRMKEGK